MAAAVPIILAAATVATTAVSIDNSNKVRESADDERRRALAESKKQKAEAQAKLDQEKIDQEAITTRTDREQGNAARCLRETIWVRRIRRALQPKHF
jgi:7-keto-8-aminopelargonate synthetase-like enzyme